MRAAHCSRTTIRQNFIRQWQKGSPSLPIRASRSAMLTRNEPRGLYFKLGHYPAMDEGQQLRRPSMTTMYLRTHWFAIDAICKLNSLPFDATGEVIKREGTWRVHEFTGRWMPSCSGIASRGAGCAAMNFIIRKCRGFAAPERHRARKIR